MSSAAARPPASLNAFVAAYEAARGRDGRGSVRDHLPPGDHPERGRILVELIRVELELDWAVGRARPLDDYCDEFPLLRGRPELLAEVASEEYRQRWERGERPDRREYRRRYGYVAAEWPDETAADLARTPPPLAELSPASVRLPDAAAEAARAFRLFRDSDGSAAPSAGGAILPPEAARAFAGLRESHPAAAVRYADAVSSFPAVGSTFAGFLLVGELGRGTFGRVFLARQGELSDRPVALKVAADLTGEPQTLAQLQHTNIVPIHSIHRVGTLQAVCMPYYGSVTLADVIGDLGRQKTIPGTGHHFVSTLNLRRPSNPGRDDARPQGPFAPPGPPDAATAPGTTAEYLLKLANYSYVEAVLWLGARLADGLEHAHDRGIVHRDLKPANVLLTDEGQPMLLDFNLADDARHRGAATGVGGTLPYMAPEHLAAFRGEKTAVDARSDLYSLGVLLFELLAGRQPHPVPAGTLAVALPELIARTAKGPPALRPLNPAVSPSTEAIVLKCLSPDPNRRYPSARALKEDLERQLSHRPLAHAREPSRRERARKWARRNPRSTSTGSVAALAAAVVLVLGAVGLGLREQNGRHEAAESYAQFRRESRGLKAALAVGLADPDSLLPAIDECRSSLARYGLPDDAEWERRPCVARLTEDARAELRREAGELLFLASRATAHQAGSGAHAEPAKFAEADRLSAVASACFPDGERPTWFEAQGEDIRRGLSGAGEVPAEARPKAAIETRSPREAYLAALKLASQGRFREALPFARQTIDAQPDQLAAWVALGHCYYGMGEHAKAEAAYDTCVALAPDSHWAFYNRGMARSRRNEFASARTDFDSALRLQPNSKQAYLNRAWVWLKLGGYTEAIADSTMALELGAPQTRIYFLRAKAYARLGNLQAASDDRRVGKRLVPTDARSWLERGMERTDEPAEALADVERALDMYPKSRSALRAKAFILSEKMWRTADAIGVLDRVVELYPDYAEARADREVLLNRKEWRHRPGATRNAGDQFDHKSKLGAFGQNGIELLD